MGGVAFAAALRADFSPAIPGPPSGPGHCPVPPLRPSCVCVHRPLFKSYSPPHSLLPQFLEAFGQGVWRRRTRTDSGKTLREFPGSDRPGRLILGPPIPPRGTHSFTLLPHLSLLTLECLISILCIHPLLLLASSKCEYWALGTPQ